MATYEPAKCWVGPPNNMTNTFVLRKTEAPDQFFFAKVNCGTDYNVARVLDDSYIGTQSFDSFSRKETLPRS